MQRLAGSECGAKLPITTQELIRLWVTAREEATPAARLALPEMMLLAALEGSVAEATAAELEVAEAQGERELAQTVISLRAQLLTLAEGDTGLAGVERLQVAWDAGAACPIGQGLPPLSAIRPDLPLQRGYRALPPSARLVLLAIAQGAGHYRVLLPTDVASRRTGLSVTDVRLALATLVERRWLQRHHDIAARVVSVAPAIFLGLRDGPWASHRRSTR